MNETERGNRKLGKVLAGMALAAALVVCADGCADPLGECEVVCTFSSDNSTSWHGPYSDYTEQECEDQAEQSESPGITTCEPEWSSY